VPALRERTSTTSAIRVALDGPRDRRLLVTLGAAGSRGNSVLSASTPAASTARSAPRVRRRSRVEIDERRPNALAAGIARAIMELSGQRELR